MVSCEDVEELARVAADMLLDGDVELDSTHGSVSESCGDVKPVCSTSIESGGAGSDPLDDTSRGINAAEVRSPVPSSPGYNSLDARETGVSLPGASPSKEGMWNTARSSIAIDRSRDEIASPYMTIPNTPGPCTFDPKLAKWHIPASAYLATNSQTHVLATGVAVFTRSTSGTDHLLLVQRASTDSHPNCWEVPGGSVDMTGETILEAAARELREETGLAVERFVAELEMTRFCTGESGGRKWWDKPTFVVEVCGAVGVGDGEVAEAATKEPGMELEMVGRMIVLDEEEHQAWMWVKEEDVRSGMCGQVPLVFVSKEQQDIMLEGFDVTKDCTTFRSTSEPR